MAAVLPRKPRRLVVAAIAAATAATLALTGCSGSTGSPASSTTKVTIWTWSNETRQALEGGILETYEKAHPGVDVEILVQPDKDYQTLLTTGLSASGGPDIAMIRSYGVLSSFADSGNLAPLDDAITDWSGFSELARTGASSRSDGKVYAVPQGVQTAQVYYNKKVFTDLGLSVPITWDEFVKTAEAIKASGTTPIVIPGGVAAQISLAGEVLGNARRGGDEFAKKFVAGEAKLTDPENVAAIDLMAQIQPYLIDNVTSVTLDEAVTVFATGKAAMFPSGTWQVATFANLDTKIDYGTFDLPVNPDWPSGQVTVAYADGGWALSARSEHAEQAKELLNWFASADFANLYANAMGTIPARDGVTLKNELISEMYARYLKNPSTYLGAAYLRYGNPWGTDLYGEQVQKLWLGQTDSTKAAAAIQTGIDAWFNPDDFK